MNPLRSWVRAANVGFAVLLPAVMAGAVLPLSASFSSAAEPSTRFPGKTWERRTPGEAGLDEGKLNAFIRRLATPAKDPGDGPTSDDPDFSGCIIKDGYMVASWG